MKEIGITISLIVNGEEIEQASAGNFESAEEALGKMQRRYEGKSGRLSDIYKEPEDNYEGRN